MRLRTSSTRIEPARVVPIRRAATAVLAVFAIVVGVPLAAASPADGSSSRWTWTSSVRVTHYSASGSGNVTCPTTTLCLAADSNRVMWSTHPTVAKSWSSAVLEPLTSPYLIGGDVAIQAIDCATAHFCAAVDNMGQIFTSADPTGGPTTWTKSVLNSDTYPDLSAVSCASATTCAVLADSGAAFTLTPSGWQRAQLISRESPDNAAVSCASSTLCAAVESDGNIYTINPSVGGAWKHTKIGKVPRGGWDSIDCPSASMCVAVGNDEGTGGIAVSKSLAAGTWKSSTLKGASGGLYGVSCRSAKFCVAIGGNKNYWTTKPSAATSAWHAFGSRAVANETGVACLTSKACFVGDTTGKLGIGHRR